MSASAPRFLVNGIATDRITVQDRGFTLGDGLFETVAVRGGRPRLWTEHCQRLAEGCQRLGLPPPDPALLHAELEHCRDNQADGTIRITCTRGTGPRGYALPERAEPTRVIAWYPGLPSLSERPLTLRWCRTPLAENPALAGIKHLNRLEQVLARAEWDDPAIDEGVMCSTAGDVVECTSCNLFAIHDATLRTADVSRCGVAGVMRRHVLDLAAGMSLPVEVGRLTVQEVLTADELFVTNASRGIAAVGRLDDRTWNAPGDCTRQLQQAMEAAR